ncbi:MAG TPA: hypothetical protein VGE42_08235 [Candidatus Dormibacteraeota bacterium]|jgi:hypothetical protein
MGLGLLRIIGIALAMVGAGMAVAPRLTRRALLLVGVHWEPDPRSRVASWGLVILGLVVVVLSRVVR